MDTPKLFYAARACSAAAMVALDWAQIKFEPVEISLASDRASLRIYSAEARVPALVVNERVITETMAILLWASQAKPEAQLLPEGNALVDAISLMGWIASRLHIVRRQYVLPKHFSDDATAHASISAQALPKYLDALRTLDRHVEAGAVATPALKAYALVFAAWAVLDEIGLVEFPHLAALSRDLSQDSVVQLALRRHGLTL